MEKSYPRLSDKSNGRQMQLSHCYRRRLTMEKRTASAEPRMSFNNPFPTFAANCASDLRQFTWFGESDHIFDRTAPSPCCLRSTRRRRPPIRRRVHSRLLIQGHTEERNSFDCGVFRDQQLVGTCNKDAGCLRFRNARFLQRPCA